MDRPYIVQSAVEIPGVCEVHDNIIDDAATKAEYWLEHFGIKNSLWLLPELQHLSTNGGWRRSAAKLILIRFQRAMLAEFGYSPISVQNEAVPVF